MNAPTRPTTRRLTVPAPLLVDVVAPVALYYLLSWAGLTDVWALSVAGLIPGASVLLHLARRRRVDRMGLMVLTMFALGVALTVWTGDARLVLAKPALFVAVAGVFCLSTLRGRPMLHAVAEPMATHGDPALTRAWHDAWATSVPFQRALRASTAAFGAALLIDAAGRVAVTYTLDLHRAVALANLPGLLALGGAIVFHLRHVKPVFHRYLDTRSANAAPERPLPR
ncbi:VC0807 family protein [Deinococcus sonorensis]|uniref:VC0807 family protein n=2 Tax=Deinococcus sonorensis TaxID=309891 RepID=A0AAU7U6N5_9DEIO